MIVPAKRKKVWHFQGCSLVKAKGSQLVHHGRAWEWGAGWLGRFCFSGWFSKSSCVLFYYILNVIRTIFWWRVMSLIWAKRRFKITSHLQLQNKHNPTSLSSAVGINFRPRRGFSAGLLRCQHIAMQVKRRQQWTLPWMYTGIAHFQQVWKTVTSAGEPTTRWIEQTKTNFTPQLLSRRTATYK